MKGFSGGIYGTYFANADMNSGLYVYVWSQIGRYRNKAEGEAQNGISVYNSTVWSNSAEAGFGIPVMMGAERQWIAVPQVQLTYNHCSGGDYRDRNGLKVSNQDADGLKTGIGMRIPGKSLEKRDIEPFLEANWLHTFAHNKSDFNGNIYQDGAYGSRGEAKAGIQGKIADNWNVFAQVSGQWGRNHYRHYQGQINLTRSF